MVPGICFHPSGAKHSFPLKPGHLLMPTALVCFMCFSFLVSLVNHCSLFFNHGVVGRGNPLKNTSVDTMCQEDCSWKELPASLCPKVKSQSGHLSSGFSWALLWCFWKLLITLLIIGQSGCYVGGEAQIFPGPIHTGIVSPAHVPCGHSLYHTVHVRVFLFFKNH